MPIYEYKCIDCGVHLEKRQSVSEAALTKCDACGGRMEKQWSLSGFQFKGEGWYVTDYAKNKDAGKSAVTANTEKTSTAESTPAASSASNETKKEKKAEPAAKKD
jgi:putative FmdB family regulatory protein